MRCANRPSANLGAQPLYLRGSSTDLFLIFVVTLQHVNPESHGPGTQEQSFAAWPGACPGQLGLACPSAGCCQLQGLQQNLNCPGEDRAIPPLLPINSACCLGSLGQYLISFKFKTKQALLYFLCFAFFHM